MLTEKDFIRLERQASELYGDLELEIIQEIAERIANVGYMNTVAYNNTIILQEMGYLYDDIIKLVAEYNETSVTQIREIFESAGVRSIKRDDVIYKLAGLKPNEISESMKRLIERRADQTSYNLIRLTRTTASEGQMQFIQGINQAYLETSTGAKSYTQSITDVVRRICKNGAYVQYPSGAKRSIESATRMNILTATNQMSGELQLERGRDLGWDLYEVTAHSGARPEHAEWQGKVYTEKELYDICGYGSILGLCGINCRHTFRPYYKGSTKAYTSKELREMKNSKVEYNGAKISEYEASQIQRSYERQIRESKKEIAGLKGLQNSEVDIKTEMQQAKARLKNRNAKLNDFLDQTGFRKDNSRLVI